jgi:hypothetical protein
MKLGTNKNSHVSNNNNNNNNNNSNIGGKNSDAFFMTLTKADLNSNLSHTPNTVSCKLLLD